MTATSKVLRAVNPLGILVTLAFVAVWEVVVRTEIIRFDYLPAPSEVVVALWDQLVSGVMLSAIGHTLWVSLVAAGMACVLGILIGALLGTFPTLRAFTLASVDFLRSVPAVALMPVALLLLGPAPETEILVASYAALWPILINTLGGVRAINPRLTEVALTLHISGPDAMRKIVIPSATPSILVGARLSIVTALVVAIIAEMMVNPAGIGWQLVSAQQSLRPDILFAYAVAAGILGLLLNVLLVNVTRAIMPGSPALRELS